MTGMRARLLPWSNASAAGHFRDPDGHVWEIAWDPGFTLVPDGSIILPDFGAA